ncbi:MAG TPA: TRAP transporter large permease [Desulfobacterales bacterium]|nr:TRAP transporter large permease [Desulfobacterales bacterium]
MTWLLAILTILGLAAGAPLAYIVGASGVLAFVATDQMRYLAVLPQRIFSQIDSFSLMAMCLFITTGEIMNRTGVTKALVDFSMCLVGRFRGGLGYVNVLTSVFFAGVSGSAVADAAALSNTLVPAMVQKGYPRSYAAAITVAGSIIGPILPPSIILIFYGALMQVSIGGLLAAGVLPGFLLGLALMIGNYIFARRQHHPGGRNEASPPFFPTLFRAIPALMLPVIILGGIVVGVVTPTEAAALAVSAAIVAGFFYGGVDLSKVIESLRRTAILSGSIFMIMAAAACAAWIGALQGWPESLASLVQQFQFPTWGFLLMVNFVFIVAGTVMEPPMCLALLVPLLGPACVVSGVHPIHLGIVLCLNMTLGLASPPVGGSLAVVAAITGEDYWSLCRAVVPFLVVEGIVLLVLIFVPEISLVLPRYFGLA